jgi:hypothetical protein
MSRGMRYIRQEEAIGIYVYSDEEPFGTLVHFGNQVTHYTILFMKLLVLHL